MERLNIVLVLGRSREGGGEGKKKSLCSHRNELDDLRGKGGGGGGGRGITIPCS